MMKSSMPSITSVIVAAMSSCLIGQDISKPNIVIILADDLGYGELGCQGNPQIPTPNIDAIAAAGIRFTSGYVTGPNCSPSRAGLLTGRIQTRFGHEHNPIGARNELAGHGLPLTEKTIADHMLRAGYVSAVIGKWHLGGTAEFHPYRRGFDEFFGFTHEGHYFVPPPWDGVSTMLRRKVLPGGGEGRRTFRNVTYSTHMGNTEPDYDANNPIVRGSQPINETAYLTDAWTREAVSFINRNRDKPFILYLAHNAVHSPLQGADKYMKRFAHIKDIHRRIFAAMLANLDDSVGEVMAAIRNTGNEGKTIVFFLSDNGGPTRELTSSNLPLRGGKGQLYEGGIRIPFMVQWKGTLPAGKVYDKMVVSTDIFATSLALAGVQSMPETDGVNLMPYLLGQNKDRPHEKMYWRQANKSAVRVGDWKLVRHGSPKKAGPWELYDLNNDLTESKNLKSANHQKFQALLQIWKEYESRMIDAVF
jgi:arylsulfatase B